MRRDANQAEALVQDGFLILKAKGPFLVPLFTLRGLGVSKARYPNNVHCELSMELLWPKSLDVAAKQGGSSGKTQSLVSNFSASSKSLLVSLFLTNQ